jgi:F-type H+-transporting ATPase subunit beta
MLTSRGVTRLSRRAVSGAKRTSLFSTSAPVLARAALSASAGTHSSLRPTRFPTSTSSMSLFSSAC